VQPPAWEQYQKQVKLWEQEIAALQVQQPSVSMQQLTVEVRKPPLFAFCLRPRGLEAHHKLSKQKSHRKQPWPGSAPRAWVGLGSLDGSLDRRQYYTEPGNGAPAGMYLDSLICVFLGCQYSMTSLGGHWLLSWICWVLFGRWRLSFMW
jgi:hypothetical protein